MFERAEQRTKQNLVFKRRQWSIYKGLIPHHYFEKKKMGRKGDGAGYAHNTADQFRRQLGKMGEDLLILSFFLFCVARDSNWHRCVYVR